MPISKTDFVRALQCRKMLWMDSHFPEERVIPPEVQAKLDAGNEFGDKAMGIFGDYVETTTFREDGRLYFSEMIKKTKTLLEAGERVICEASFTWYGNFCAADILKKEEGGYVLYEVKNAFDVRKEFITDLGFQRLLLKKCGVKLLASKLILRGDQNGKTTTEENANADENADINTVANIAANAKTPEEIPAEKSPFSQTKNIKQRGQGCVELLNHDGFTYKIIDVTTAAKAMERLAEKHVFEFGKIKRKDAECPTVGIGEHCDTPYRCWYYDFCRKAATDHENKKA